MPGHPEHILAAVGDARGDEKPVAEAVEVADGMGIHIIGLGLGSRGTGRRPGAGALSSRVRAKQGWGLA